LRSVEPTLASLAVLCLALVASCGRTFLGATTGAGGDGGASQGGEGGSDDGGGRGQGASAQGGNGAAGGSAEGGSSEGGSAEGGSGEGGVGEECGNGSVDPGEECDDGNGSNQDACLVGCIQAACGDGFVWNGVEGCDLGALNENRPALEIEQGMLLSPVVPFDTQQPGPAFYNYFSSSSHTGFEDVEASRIYFQRHIGTEVLSLIMHHGIDAFPQQPATSMDFTLTGLPSAVQVTLADDAFELFKPSATVAVGNWFFANNTDGGVLGGFPLPGNWEVTLTSSFGNDVSSWDFIDGATLFLSLTPEEPLILRAYDTPSACRLDCTLPSCGDGVLDGGEICDDGNNTPGDGCAPACDSLTGN
jgi:cysteine-rich repeat protein